MNRRDFMGGIVALATASAMPIIPTGRTPWDARAKELLPTDGMWSDYSAWCEWMGTHYEAALEEPRLTMTAYLYTAVSNLALAGHPCDWTEEEMAALVEAAVAKEEADQRIYRELYQ